MAVYQGTYFSQPFTLQDASSVAIDITGWAFKADFRTDVEDETAALELTSANSGFVITDAANGRFELQLTAVQTAELAEGTYVFDVLRTDAVLGPVWLFAGKITIKEPVTR
jgi:hypothetical protein